MTVSLLGAWGSFVEGCAAQVSSRRAGARTTACACCTASGGHTTTCLHRYLALAVAVRCTVFLQRSTTCRPVERNALITQGGCGGLEGGSAELGAAAAAGGDDHPRARLHKQLAEKRKKRSKARPAAAAASAAVAEDGNAVAGGTDSVMSAQMAGGEAGEGACSGGSAAGDSVASLPVTAPAGDSKRQRERCKGGGGAGEKGGVRAGSVGSQPRSAVASAQKKMVLRAKVRAALSAANG